MVRKYVASDIRSHNYLTTKKGPLSRNVPGKRGGSGFDNHIFHDQKHLELLVPKEHVCIILSSKLLFQAKYLHLQKELTTVSGKGVPPSTMGESAKRSYKW